MKENLYTTVFYKKNTSHAWELEIVENLTKDQFIAAVGERIVHSYPKLSFGKIYNKFVQYEAPEVYSEIKTILRINIYNQKTLKEVNPYFLHTQIEHWIVSYNQSRQDKWFYKRYPYYSGFGPVPGAGKKKNLKYYRAIDRNVAVGKFLNVPYVEQEFESFVNVKQKSPYIDPWEYDLRSTTNKKSWKLKKTRKKQWQKS